MIHADHVNLIRGGVPGAGETLTSSPVWADFGSGTGAFTLALAECLGPASVIYSIDREHRALAEQARRLAERFPAVRLHPIAADFTRPIQLPPLDGLVVANALHFQRHPGPVVRRLRATLKPGGRFVIVEYNLDRGNFAVPYPISFPSWEALARQAGFAETRLLATRPSRSFRAIYSAVSW